MRAIAIRAQGTGALTKGMLALSLACAGLTAVPANAQSENFERIVTIMRACAQIADINARVQCYDNNIMPRTAGSQSSDEQRTQASGPTSQVAPSPPVAVAVAAPDSPQQFGRETVPQRQREDSADQADALEAQVLSTRRMAPGIYEFTLSGDALWRLVDNAPSSYDPPSAGSKIRIERGSLGSFFLHYAGQRTLRIRRVN